MKLKPLVITVAVLLVLAGITWIATRPPAPVTADARVGKALAPTEKIARAARVVITDNGKKIELARGADQTWRNASYYDLPVDFPKLTRLVSDLTGAKIERFVSADPERVKRLDFNGAQIAFHAADSIADAAPLYSIDIGRTADNGGRFVRHTGETKAYLASLNLWLDTEPKNWADSALVPLKTADIAKVEFTFPDAPPLAFARKEKTEPFAPDPAREGWKTKTSALDSQLNTLTTLRFRDTVDLDTPDAAEAKKHARTVTLTAFDNRAVTITMGRRPAKTVPKPAAQEPKPDAATGGTTGPETETIPAGAVYIQITDTKSDSPVNALMQKRAVETYDHVFTGLPAAPGDLLEKIPEDTPPPPADKK